MNTTSAIILGVCIVIAAAIVSLKPSDETRPVQPEIMIHQTNGRFQISNPGEKGTAFVIDTENGRVWRDVIGMSGATSGQSFYDEKPTQD